MNGGNSLVAVVSMLVLILEGYLSLVFWVRGMEFRHEEVLVVVLEKLALARQEVMLSPLLGCVVRTVGGHVQEASVGWP